jgi:hypothetical protein
MRRHSKSIGGSAKTRLRKKATQKRRHGSITQRPRVSRTVRRDTEIDSLTREMSTIAEQHRATTEVLKLISSSSDDPQEVFANILASAARICDADNGAINRWDGEALHLVATHNMPRAFIELREQTPSGRSDTPPAAVCWRPEGPFTLPIYPRTRLTLMATGRLSQALRVLGRCSLCRC